MKAVRHCCVASAGNDHPRRLTRTVVTPANQPAPDQCPPSIKSIAICRAELTDPDRPAANKTDIVTPGFTPDEAGTIDDHLTEMDGTPVFCR